MGKRWFRIRLRLPSWAEDAVVLFLIEAGIPGVQLDETSGHSQITFYSIDGNACMSLIERLRAYLDALEQVHDRSVPYGLEADEIEDADWAEAWKAHFRAALVSRRIMVKPSWEACRTPEGKIAISIDPGLAFGTGLHATTRLCIEWIDEMASGWRGRPPASALDLGTGTGILAIVLAKMGVQRVWALDVDPLATKAARGNAIQNGVESRLIVLDGSMERVANMAFPLIVANLTAPVLFKASGELCRILAPEGLLLLSGILAEETGFILDAFSGQALRCLETRQMEEWSAVLLVKDASRGVSTRADAPVSCSGA